MRGKAFRIVLWALSVLGLVGLVTIAAAGSTPTGSGDSRRPSYALFDTALSLALVAMLASVVFLVYAVAHGNGSPTDNRRPGRDLLAIVGVVAFAILIGTSDVSTWLQSTLREPAQQSRVGATPNRPEDETGAPNRPAFTWVPLAVILSFTAVAVAAMVLAERRRRRARFGREAVEEAIVDALDDMLDDLRAEADPRRAVIAAYARLERVLAAHGVARSASETQEEYVARIFGQLEIDFRSIRRLTDLFVVAKFSQHVVDVDMKEEAIDILEQVRDELRAAETHSGEQPASALPAGPA
jgi:tetrahydromethanopterin S-methyltransferase subunit B